MNQIHNGLQSHTFCTRESLLALALLVLLPFLTLFTLFYFSLYRIIDPVGEDRRLKLITVSDQADAGRIS